MPFTPDYVSDWFWDLVQRANNDRHALENLLGALSNDQLRRFAMEFREAAGWLHGPPYLVSGSEDHIDDMSLWIVSQGKNFYATIWAHPESLAAYEHVNPYPNLGYAAEGMLYDRLGDAVDDDPYWDIDEALTAFSRSGYATIREYVEAQKPREER